MNNFDEYKIMMVLLSIGAIIFLPIIVFALSVFFDDKQRYEFTIKGFFKWCLNGMTLKDFLKYILEKKDNPK